MTVSRINFLTACFGHFYWRYLLLTTSRKYDIVNVYETLSTGAYQPVSFSLLHHFIRAAGAGKSFWFGFKGEAHAGYIADRFF